MKKTITLFLAVMLVLTSIPAFAYSTTGAGMFSAYYQGDSTSPWQAEVTFEKSGVKNAWGTELAINEWAKPIQYLDRGEKQICATAYFTQKPASATDAKLVLAYFVDNDLAAIVTTPVNADTLMAKATLDVQNYYVYEEGTTSLDYDVNYYARAFVWDGVTPMTQLREISTWSMNITGISVDGTAYTSDPTTAGGVFIDNGLGFIDIDESVITDKTNVDLVIKVGANHKRILKANGEIYPIDASTNSFTLNDVDLSNGLAFTLGVDGARSEAHYIINPKASVDFTPNNTPAFTDSINTQYTKGTPVTVPATPGTETKLGRDLSIFANGTSLLAPAHIRNWDFGDSTVYTDEVKSHIYTSLYNDNGRILYRMFHDGTYPNGKANGKDFSQVFFNLKDATTGSFVYEIKFKAEPVADALVSASAEAKRDAVGHLSFNVQANSSDFIRITGTRDGLMTPVASNSARAQQFFRGKSFTSDGKYRTIRVYVRRLADGSIHTRYYSCFEGDGFVALASQDNATASTPSAATAVNRLLIDGMSNINQAGTKAYPTDVYIDHIRLYKTTEVPAA